MAKAEKKVLGLLPRGITTTLLLGLVVVVVLALIWSWVMSQSFSDDNSWVTIIELLLFAVLVGLAVGMLANNESAVTLWAAAGLTFVGIIVTYSLMGAGAYAVSVDDALLGTLEDVPFLGFAEDGLMGNVTIGAVILGIIAAACAAIGSRTKDILAK